MSGIAAEVQKWRQLIEALGYRCLTGTDEDATVLTIMNGEQVVGCASLHGDGELSFYVSDALSTAREEGARAIEKLEAARVRLETLADRMMKGEADGGVLGGRQLSRALPGIFSGLDGNETNPIKVAREEGRREGLEEVERSIILEISAIEAAYRTLAKSERLNADCAAVTSGMTAALSVIRALKEKQS